MTTTSIFFGCYCLVLTNLIVHCNSLSSPNPKVTEVSRRDVFRTVVSTSLAVPAVLTTALSNAQAADDEELIDVYFGCGCFWHVQHEFVEAEKKILNRNDSSLTARAGYAGGLGTSDKVCYHNAKNVGDYGTLGHAEVVAVRIPSSSFEDFTKEYFKLFDDKGNRPDQNGDRGSEYRNLIGIPGGSKSPYASKIISASQAVGDKLDFAAGKGNDRDTRKVSFIMDTEKFPFFVGEQYHQFHDGFNLNENYPNSYNGLAAKLADEGKLGDNACPNGTFGLGVLGL
mmetsp:Transcript_20810/g.20030  ORF Transcript_20810/g.20030 Transcript_20810/m.20030 type:complete len:284 (-) Transcript_20810:234-1085(-)